METPGISIFMKFTNKLVDYTNLKPDASHQDLTELAQKAKKQGFNSICIRSDRIKEFAETYRCSATINFPTKIYYCNSDEDKKSIIKEIGNHSLEEKLAEAKQALNDGAAELDPVINLANVSKHDFKKLRAELNGYIELMQSYDKPLWLKPIFSCELLEDYSIEFSIDILAQVVAGAQLNKIKVAYKNSTGFIKTENDYPLKTTSQELISLITENLNEYDQDARINIKAAGGIKDIETAETIIEAAAGRLSHIGTSSDMSY